MFHLVLQACLLGKGCDEIRPVQGFLRRLYIEELFS